MRPRSGDTAVLNLVLPGTRLHNSGNTKFSTYSSTILLATLLSRTYKYSGTLTKLYHVRPVGTKFKIGTFKHCYKYETTDR
eukprot:SAG31_NODE_3295_length_4448_cov_3.127616_2_plen_81_part_00